MAIKFIGQISIEFTILLMFFLLVFVAVLFAVKSFESEQLALKSSAELSYLCNYMSDAVVQKNTLHSKVSVFVPLPTYFEFRDHYLICKRGGLVSASPVPGGFVPSFSGEINGWVDL